MAQDCCHRLSIRYWHGFQFCGSSFQNEHYLLRADSPQYMYCNSFVLNALLLTYLLFSSPSTSTSAQSTADCCLCGELSLPSVVSLVRWRAPPSVTCLISVVTSLGLPAACTLHAWTSVPTCATPTLMLRYWGPFQKQQFAFILNILPTPLNQASLCAIMLNFYCVIPDLDSGITHKTLNLAWLQLNIYESRLLLF